MDTDQYLKSILEFQESYYNKTLKKLNKELIGDLNWDILRKYIPHMSSYYTAALENMEPHLKNLSTDINLASALAHNDSVKLQEAIRDLQKTIIDGNYKLHTIAQRTTYMDQGLDKIIDMFKKIIDPPNSFDFNIPKLKSTLAPVMEHKWRILGGFAICLILWEFYGKRLEWTTRPSVMINRIGTRIDQTSKWLGEKLAIGVGTLSQLTLTELGSAVGDILNSVGNVLGSGFGFFKGFNSKSTSVSNGVIWIGSVCFGIYFGYLCSRTRPSGVRIRW